MMGWSAYSSACKEIENLYEEHKKLNPIQSPIGWDFTPLEQRMAA
jgi:chromosome partitioning protein